MATVTEAVEPRTPFYPDSDGEPLADNTKQFECITTIKGGLEAQHLHEVNVFVAGNLFWYPEEGKPNIRMAPDVMVVFGRPKGHRGSYQQWREDGIAPQVIFEIWSPGNRLGEMTRKFNFYQRYGVEEYYLYDPDAGSLWGWLRKGDTLEEIAEMVGWVSPRLQVRFELASGELVLSSAAGRKFASYVELAKQAVELAEQAAQARERAERLEAQLRALGIKPEA